jgi:2'-5' RNA ligase
VLTALFDPASALRFDAMRRAYFPAKRNFVPAHCTLFHKLPGERKADVVLLLGRLCASARPFTAFTSSVLNFGRGVAYGLDAPGLVAFRQEVAHAFSPWLSDQDRQRYRPHVTVQNKVDPAVARHLLASLEDDFAPWPVRIEGVCLWRYRGGPWDSAGTFRFGQEAPPA